MNQQTMDNYLNRYKVILQQIKDEVKKICFKEEEIKRREQNILKIKDNTTEILKILKGTNNTINKTNEQNTTKIKQQIGDIQNVFDQQTAIKGLQHEIN